MAREKCQETSSIYLNCFTIWPKLAHIFISRSMLFLQSVIQSVSPNHKKPYCWCMGDTLGITKFPCNLVFTESVPRPIQSISCRGIVCWLCPLGVTFYQRRTETSSWNGSSLNCPIKNWLYFFCIFVFSIFAFGIKSLP